MQPPMLETFRHVLKSTSTIKDNYESEDKVMAHIWANDAVMKFIPFLLNSYHDKRETKSPAKAKAFKATGNEQFQAKNYSQSIESYTKSAMYASANGCDLPVAIANRSAALFYLNRYNECIKDIELALALGYPEEFHHKLYLRKIQCYLKLGKHDLAKNLFLKAQQAIGHWEDIRSPVKDDIEKRISELTLDVQRSESSTEDTKTDISSKCKPKITYGENPNFLYASAGIDVKYNEEKGRHVIANRPLKKGDILFIEKPFAFVLIPSDIQKNLCAHCCKFCADIPVPCTTCLDTFYCGIKCSKEAWSSYHRWQCAGNQMGFSEMFGIFHLALKVLLTCTTTTNKIKFNKIQELQSNFKEFDTDNLMVCGSMAALHTVYLSEYTDFFKVNDIEESLKSKFSDEALNFNCDISTDSGTRLYISSLLLRYSLQLICNASAIEKEILDSEEENDIGSGIYPSASMMSHSCNPNIINTFMDQHLIVRAAKDIAVGEEVFYSYGVHYRFKSFEDRQSTLKQQYFFICKCEACTVPKFQYFMKRFTALRCRHCDGALYKNNSNTFRCLDCGIQSNPVSHLVAIDQATQMSAAAEVAIRRGQLEEALNKYKKCLRIQKSVLYKYHKALITTIVYIAAIYYKTGRWTNYIFYAEQTIPARSEMYGPFSLRHMKDLNSLLDGCLNYFREESNTSTKLYKEMQEKTQKYLDLMENIIHLNYGEWSSACDDVKAKRKIYSSYLRKGNI